MSLRIKMVEKRVTVVRATVGECVAAGETYEVIYRSDRKGDVHFWNAAKRCATRIAGDAFVNAVKSGAILVEA